MPPKKTQGARRRGTTLSLNDFLRYDDDSKPTDTNPPMATNGSGRSRNSQPSNRSRINTRRNGDKLSPSAVGSYRSNPLNPTDTKPPMATYGSSRSRNSARQYYAQTSISAVGSSHSFTRSVGSNRSCNKSRRNGDRPSASAVGSYRSRQESNPSKPTDTKPRYSSHNYQFSGPVGSNCSGNKTRQNYENPHTAELGSSQPSTSLVGFSQPFSSDVGPSQPFSSDVEYNQLSGNNTRQNDDQESNPPIPEPTDTNPPLAANGAGFPSYNTLQNDDPPNTSAVGSSCINWHQNDDGPSTSAAAAAANRRDLTGAAPSVWVSANSPRYPYQGGAPRGILGARQFFGLGYTQNIWNLAAPLALQASSVDSSQNLVMRQAVVDPSQNLVMRQAVVDPSQNLVMRQAVVDPSNRPPGRTRRGQRTRHRRGRRGTKPLVQFGFMVESNHRLRSIALQQTSSQPPYWNDQQESYSGDLPQPQSLLESQYYNAGQESYSGYSQQPQSLLESQCYNVKQESYNGYSYPKQSTMEQQYIDAQPQSYNGSNCGGIGVAEQQPIATIYHRRHQQIINTQNRNHRIERYRDQQHVPTPPIVRTRRIHPGERPQPLEFCPWEGTKISRRRRLQRRRRISIRPRPSETVEMENAFSVPEPPLEPLFCNCKFPDQDPISQTTANSVSSSNSATFLAVPIDRDVAQMGRFLKMPVQMLVPPGRIDIPAHISTSMVIYNPESGVIAACLDSEPLPPAMENNNYNVSQSVFRMASLPSTGVGTDRAGAGSTFWAGCSLPSSRCCHDREFRFLSSWCHTPMGISFHTGQFQERRPLFSQHPAQSLLQIQINAITQNPVLDSTILSRQKGVMNTPYRSVLHKNEKFPFSPGLSAPTRNSLASLSTLLQVQRRKQEMVFQMENELSFLRCSIHSSIQTFQNSFHGGLSQNPMPSLKLIAIYLEDTKTTNQEQVKVKLKVKEALCTTISLSDVKEEGEQGDLRIATKSFPILSTDAQGPLPTGPTPTVSTYTQYSGFIDDPGIAAPAERSLISRKKSDQMSTQKHIRVNQFAESSAKLAMRLEVF